MALVELRGITWDHERGYNPLAHSITVYEALFPDVRITWERRSLREFGDGPLEDLAQRFDMLIVDHPFVGLVARERRLLPLDQWVPDAHLRDLRENSVGPSFASYDYDGHLWALPIDAAAHVSASRADLLERAGCARPRSWEDVFAVADALPAEVHIAFPAIALDTMMAFCSMAASLGVPPMRDQDRVVPADVGREALEMLARLAAVSHPASFELNPPALLERMATTDEIAYCPLTFGYSNYSRPGHRPNAVSFGDVPGARPGEPGRGILGGAGFAVSATSGNAEAACAYGAWLTSADVQRSHYFASGGQPAHRAAWLDPAVNAASDGFFTNTIATLDRAYLRPRHAGYMNFQERAGELVRSYLLRGPTSDPAETLASLERLYRATTTGPREDQ